MGVWKMVFAVDNTKKIWCVLYCATWYPFWRPYYFFFNCFHVKSMCMSNFPGLCIYECAWLHLCYRGFQIDKSTLSYDSPYFAINPLIYFVREETRLNLSSYKWKVIRTQWYNWIHQHKLVPISTQGFNTHLK